MNSSTMQMGVMSVQTAREMLGLDRAQESSRIQKQEKKETEGMYASVNDDHICDECGFFDADNNRCTVTDEERRFDQSACRQFIKSEDMETAD